VLCIMCGKKIRTKYIEGADFLKDSRGQRYCMTCAIQCLDRWPEFERIENLALDADRYRTSLVETLEWSIGQGYCVRPKEYCRADPEKCLKCWLNHLIGEENDWKE
jgi:hypothetical protein